MLHREIASWIAVPHPPICVVPQGIYGGHCWCALLYQCKYIVMFRSFMFLIQSWTSISPLSSSGAHLVCHHWFPCVCAQTSECYGARRTGGFGIRRCLLCGLVRSRGGNSECAASGWHYVSMEPTCTLMPYVSPAVPPAVYVHPHSCSFENSCCMPNIVVRHDTISNGVKVNRDQYRHIM